MIYFEIIDKTDAMKMTYTGWLWRNIDKITYSSY